MVISEEQALLAQGIFSSPWGVKQRLAARQLTGRLLQARDHYRATPGHGPDALLLYKLPADTPVIRRWEDSFSARRVAFPKLLGKLRWLRSSPSWMWADSGKQVLEPEWWIRKSMSC
jgi:hypothetical protein